MGFHSEDNQKSYSTYTYNYLFFKDTDQLLMNTCSHTGTNKMGLMPLYTCSSLQLCQVIVQ